jgi:hypothetical protein
MTSHGQQDFVVDVIEGQQLTGTGYPVAQDIQQATGERSVAGAGRSERR